ncbi:hypothetical protein ACFE04_022321 [Oxalis oulophora]
MDFLFNGMMSEDRSDCPFDMKDVERCPFLRNISKPTSFPFFSMSFPVAKNGVNSKGPIFEDGPNFDMAFKLFHGKDGVVPLSRKSQFQNDIEPQHAPEFNPLAGKFATVSLSTFGSGWPFGFGPFSDKGKNQKKRSDSNKRKPSSEQQKSSSHEALGNEWLESGNCPIAKSYRAVSHVLPLVVTVLQPPKGMKFKCPPAVVAARAALARTALVKNLRPQPLPAKMLAIALLGMAANVPLGVWREHTQKFSLSWFAAVHAAVPFIAMLRKSVVMPKTAMALTIGASILGQVIGSRAERHRLKGVTEREKVDAQISAIASSAAVFFPNQDDRNLSGHCGKEEMSWETVKGVGFASSSTSTGKCF